MSNSDPISVWSSICTLAVAFLRRASRTSLGEINFAAILGAMVGSVKTYPVGSHTTRPIASRYRSMVLKACFAIFIWGPNWLKRTSQWIKDWSFEKSWRVEMNCLYEDGIWVAWVSMMRPHSLSTNERSSWTLSTEVRELTVKSEEQIGSLGHLLLHEEIIWELPVIEKSCCSSECTPTRVMFHFGTLPETGRGGRGRLELRKSSQREICCVCSSAGSPKLKQTSIEVIYAKLSDC